MAYDDAEIRAAVERLMVTKTRFPTQTRAGVRRVDVTFNDIQEAAASTFLLNHDALFYLSELSAKRLRYDVAAYKTVVVLVDDLVGTLERAPVPIEDVTPLADATSALLQLETVSGTSKTREISTSPAYVRFRQKVDLFLTNIKGNVVKNGAIVESIEQSQGSIASAVSGLAATHAEVVERLKFISALQTTYDALELPHAMLRNTVTNARKLVELKAYRIRNQTEEQNQLEIRDTVLDLLATKAVMKRATLFAAPAASRTMTGAITPFASATRAATPAVLETIAGPFDVRDTSGGSTSTLTFEFDGSSTSYDVEIPATSELVALRGSKAGPYTFVSSDQVASAVSDVVGAPTMLAVGAMTIYLSSYAGAATHEATVVVGVASGLKSATTIAGEIDAAIVTASMDAYFEAVVTAGSVEIRSLVGGLDQNVQVLTITSELRGILGAHLIGAHVGVDKNNILNLRAGSAATPFDQWFTMPVGSYTAEEVATFITLAAPGAMPMTATAVEYGYSTPPYKVVRLECTSSDADAVMQVLTTYDPGTGDEPALAYHELSLFGAVERGNVALSALGLHEQLRQYEDLGTGNRELWDRAVLTTDGSKVSITSKSSLLASRVKVSGNGCAQFFGAASVEIRGTTNWWELSAQQAQLTAGDTLLTHTGVDASYIIDEVEQPYVHVTADVPTDLGTFNFGTNVPPWAEVTFGKKQDLDVLAVAIDAWLVTWEDATSYLTELTRLLNMVLADKNPTSAEINDVQAHLGLLEAGLISIYNTLLAHTAERSEELDDLIRTYREKGCERAIDLLLECRLEDFFNLTLETASYSGNMLSALRSVARSDMPVNKYNRRYRDNERLLATVPSPDYEHDFSDSEDDDMLGDDELALDEL